MCADNKAGFVATDEFYQIRVKGHLGPEWSTWFDGLTITNEPHGEAVLAGPVVDQAALHGLLVKVRDLGLTLLSVNRAERNLGEGRC